MSIASVNTRGPDKLNRVKGNRPEKPQNFNPPNPPNLQVSGNLLNPQDGRQANTLGIG